MYGSKNVNPTIGCNLSDADDGSNFLSDIYDLNSRLKVPYYEASAITGYNVAATLKKIISSSVISIQKKLL